MPGWNIADVFGVVAAAVPASRLRDGGGRRLGIPRLRALLAQSATPA